MELPHGVTGFWHVRDSPLPRCDLRAFRGHCHKAARLLNGRVVETHDAVYRSYARATLDLRDGAVTVLLNSFVPIVAFAKPRHDVVVELIDHSDLANIFREFGIYEVPDMLELTARPTPEICTHLSPAEMHQVKYWKPQTVAEIIFNWWD
jgi:hypothetical protein